MGNINVHFCLFLSEFAVRVCYRAGWCVKELMSYLEHLLCTLSATASTDDTRPSLIQVICLHISFGNFPHEMLLFSFVSILKLTDTNA